VAMAEVSRNADQILEAALEDVRHHDGGGHMFRAACLGLGPKGDGISYFSVKMITWAWMMICPKQSQLATVDRHMYEMLGRKGGQEGEPKREYFLAERQIRGSLDAMGYGHVPLGQGQWLLWDTKRNGPGLPHQDHSAFRGESPTYHGDVHWLPKPAEIRGLKGKTWLKDIAPQAMPYWAHPDIQAVRDQISDQWFSTIPKMYKGKNNIPWSRLQVPTPLTASAKNEVHIALDVPEPERWRIHQWFTDLDLMNSEPLDPEEYHVTVAYANTGLDNPALKHVHRLFNFAGMKFQGKKLTKFGDALVIELSSDNYADCADALNDWLEGEGISVSRHDGGFTPHITVAYTDEKLPGASIPPLSFRSPGMSFSVPRGRDELAPVWASLSPLAVALRPWDPEQAVGPSQTVQRLTRLLNAPQKFSATPTLQAAIDEWEQERHGMVHTGSAYDVRPADEGWFSHDTGTFVPRHDSKGNDTLLTKQGQGQGRVAYFEGQPVASVTWVETPHGYLIGSAYTHPDHRGKGLFNTLTQELRDSGQPVDAYRWENPWLKNKVRDWQHRVATDWPRSKLPEDEREKALGYGRRDRVKLKGRDGNYEVMYVLGAPYEGQVDVALEENPEGWKVERVNADEIEGHTTDEPWHHKYNPFHKLAPGYVGPLGLEGWHNSSNQGVEGVKREGFNFDLHQRGTWGTGAYTFLGNSGKGFNPGGPGEASTPITLKLNNGIHTVLDQVGAINRNDPGTKLMEKVWHEAGAQNHHDRRAALLNAGYDGVMVSKHLNEPYCAVAFDHPNYEVHDTPTKSSTGLMAVGDEPPRPGEYSYVAGQDKVQRTASENHEDLDWLLNAVGDSQPPGPQHNRPLNERDHDRETMDPIAFERKYDWDREGDVARGNEFTEWVPTETLAKFMEYERQPGGKDSWGNEARWKALGDHIEQHGPKNPIWLDYNHETGTAHVSEGNHRIQLALQRGIPALPTRVYRSRRKSEGAQPVTIDPSVLDPRDGWVPEYMKPSHLGLPTTTAYQPRLLSKTRQFFTRRRVAWEPVVLPGGGNSQDYRGYHANPCPACGEKEYTHSEDEDSEGRVREYWRCHSCGHYEDHRGLRSAGIKEADKLHDFLMSPKNRPDLQTPEAQQWLQYLQALHTPKNDPLTPWLTKQWKKNNIVFSPNSMMAAYSHQPNPYDYETNPIAYQNYQKMPQRRTLDPATLGHWADWYHSGHPTREGVDIMKMTTPDMHAKVDEWDTAVREEAERAREHKARQGDVVHKYGNGWTMQRLMSPEALEHEGNAMGSCVGSYADEADAGHTLIYSLRDKKSEPHVTLEVIPKKFEKPPFDLHEAIRNNSVLRSSLISDDPHLQALRKGLEDKHAELGHKSPMYQKPAFDPERHFSDPYDDKRMEWLRAQPGYQPSDPVRGVPKQDLTPEEQHQSLYYNLRKQHENMRGEPVMTQGHIEQIQGQSNQVPKPEYQEMVKEFFGQAPPEDRPYWPHKTIDDIEDLNPEVGGYHPHGDYGVENHTKYDWAAMIEDGCEDRSFHSRPKPETIVNAAAEHGQLSDLANTLDRSMQDIEHNWISDNEYRFEDDEIARWAGLYEEDYKKPNPEYDPEDEDAQWEEPEIFDEQQWEDDIHLQRQEFLEAQWEDSDQASWLYELDQLVRNARRSHQ
jgi:2'-5' RNA ligase